MRFAMLACLAVGLAMVSVERACAATPPGAVKKATLAQMGLGSMQSLSDDQGDRVRGKGKFAFVGGNTYFHVNNLGPGFAGGTYFTTSGLGFSAGGSIAFAK